MVRLIGISSAYYGLRSHGFLREEGIRLANDTPIEFHNRMMSMRLFETPIERLIILLYALAEAALLTAHPERGIRRIGPNTPLNPINSGLKVDFRSIEIMRDAGASQKLIEEMGL